MCLHRLLCLGFFVTMVLGWPLNDGVIAQEKGTAMKELERAWSLEGSWSGVASDDNKGAIYALSPGGMCVELDLKGKKQREIRIDGGGNLVRIATLSRDAGKALLVFTVWSGELNALDLNGKQLWNYPSGIDDVWASDLDGDGSDNVIVGHNGSAGLHVLDGKGELLWKSTAIGNVWHVCAGDVWGEGSPQIVTTSAAGKVHVFSSDGKKRKDLDAGCYASMVRIGKPAKKGEAATIFVAGPSLGQENNQKKILLNALAGDGTKKWSVEFPAGGVPHVDSACLASGKPWLAVGMRGGQVHVVDTMSGAIIASASDQGMIAEVGWATSKDNETPLLLVATGGNLNAYRVAKSE